MGAGLFKTILVEKMPKTWNIMVHGTGIGTGHTINKEQAKMGVGFVQNILMENISNKKCMLAIER